MERDAHAKRETKNREEKMAKLEKRKFEIRNDFHGTRATVTATQIKEGKYYISDSQTRRTKNTLCGLHDCLCGGDINQRGCQTEPFETLPNYDSRSGHTNGTYILID
jgi:hypothetical protein